MGAYGTVLNSTLAREGQYHYHDIGGDEPGDAISDAKNNPEHIQPGESADNASTPPPFRSQIVSLQSPTPPF
jgi:hypothetical protein